MLVAGIPYIRTEYWGPPSHGGAPGIHVDDGETHSDFTDFRVSAHYQLMGIGGADAARGRGVSEP
jgi:hypothetical protein